MSGTTPSEMELQFPETWDDSAVRRYLTPESHQKSRQEFVDTHIDIDKIRAEYLFPHPGSDEFVTQEEFRDAILRSELEDDNRIFILQGTTGSGKSQLCQWLEYQIGSYGDGLANDDEHVALHVSRSNTRIRDILEILTEPLDEEVTTTSVEDLDPGRVADAIITTLDAFAPTEQGVDVEDLRKLIDDSGSTTLRELLEENIRKYQTAVTSDGEEDLPDLLTEKNYRNLAFEAFGQARGGDTIFPTLRDKIHEILSQNLGVGDFQAKLEEFSERYVEKGIRPVLICEDLTTFSVLKEQLLDHLFQLDSGNFDVVLGWTSGWEEDNLDRALGVSEEVQTYMKDRAEGYLSTTDKRGRTYFLDSEATVELVRKYMSVIRNRSTSKANVDDSGFQGLYPFNPAFVKCAVNNLVQDGDDRRTPRLLLKQVIRESLNSRDPPFVAAENNQFIKEFPTEIDLKYDREHRLLSKWYGTKTLDGNIAVPVPIAEAFGVDYDPGWVRETDQGSVIVYDASGEVNPTLTVTLDGMRSPGEAITFRTELDGSVLGGVRLSVDGEVIGETDSRGELEFILPDAENEITVEAEKESLSSSETYEISEDTLDVTASSQTVEPGDRIVLTVTYNGDAVEDVTVYGDGEAIGETSEDGSVGVTVPDTDSETVVYDTEYADLSAETELNVVGREPLPVETDFSHEEVDRRKTEYQNWVTEGVEYDSRKILIDGAVSVLRRFHEPTRLGNPNALSSGGLSIYYDRGDHIPISIQGHESRASLSVDLPIGTEHTDLYDVLFWAGIGDGELPDPSMVSVDYDRLRAWADDTVGEFRAEMRATIESRLPDRMGIEELIVFTQFLLQNGCSGTDEITEELIFEKYETPSSYDSPIGERFKRRDSFREAYNDLTTHSSVPRRLAKAFFLLKGGQSDDPDKWFVDHERLESAVETVRENQDRFLQEFIQVDTSDLPQAFRIKSSRTATSTVQVDTFLEAIREYTLELDSLRAVEHAEHVVERTEAIEQWYDPDQDPETLREQFTSVFEAAREMQAAGNQDLAEWEKTRDKMEKSSLDLGTLRSDVTRFQNVDEQTGPDLLATLHEFEENTETVLAWDVYRDLDEMIDAVDDVEVDGSGQFEARVRRLDSFEQYETHRSSIETLREDL